MAMGSYLSIITLNVNGLNAPTKRQRLAEWIQKRDPYVYTLSTRDTLQSKGHIQTESEGLEKDIPHKVKVKSLSRVQPFVTPWTAAYQAPPSMEFSRQEYQSGLPFPSPEDLPHPGIEPGSPTLQADAFTI